MLYIHLQHCLTVEYSILKLHFTPGEVANMSLVSSCVLRPKVTIGVTHEKRYLDNNPALSYSSRPAPANTPRGFRSSPDMAATETLLSERVS